MENFEKMKLWNDWNIHWKRLELTLASLLSLDCRRSQWHSLTVCDRPRYHCSPYSAWANFYPCHLSRASPTALSFYYRPPAARRPCQQALMSKFSGDQPRPCETTPLKRTWGDGTLASNPLSRILDCFYALLRTYCLLLWEAPAPGQITEEAAHTVHHHPTS